MEFIRKNYEKIILGLVVLGLLGGGACMPFVAYYDQQQMADARDKVIPRKPVPLPELDLSPQQTVLDRVKSPYELDFTTTNKLFNPVLWQRQKDGVVIKAAGLGPSAAVATNIMPLYFTISFSMVTNDVGRYNFTVEDESAPLPGQRHPRHHYASKGDKVTDLTVAGKNESFVVLTNTTANPNELALKLIGTGQIVTLSPDHPFQRVDGYVADVRYDTETFKATGLRVGDHLSFAGSDYNVIAIDQNSVVLLAQSNQKKYTLRYTP